MKTILVVEDELSIAEMLRAVLEDEGYRVAVAGNGREALSSLPEVRPDIVVCDVMMPIVDGRQVCRAIQADPKYQATPIVLMSAVPETVIRSGSDDFTYSAFILKPFNMDQLLDTVERLASDDPAM
jgi:CheY-like chemotaxis protein